LNGGFRGFDGSIRCHDSCIRRIDAGRSCFNLSFGSDIRLDGIVQLLRRDGFLFGQRRVTIDIKFRPPDLSR